MADTQTFQPWDRQEREPSRWYLIFIKYFIGMGINRSLRKAYLKQKQEESEEAYEKAIATRGCPNVWYQMATRWNWKERAEAWDEEQTLLAITAVEEAAKKLRLLAPSAVEALALSLASEKYRVQAAKEILDRGGLPSVSKQEVQKTIEMRAEDIEEALKDVDEWEEKTFNGNG